MEDDLDPLKDGIECPSEDSLKLAREIFEASHRPGEYQAKVHTLSQKLGLPRACTPVGVAKGRGRSYLIIKYQDGQNEAMYTVDMTSGKLHQRLEKHDGGYYPSKK